MDNPVVTVKQSQWESLLVKPLENLMLFLGTCHAVDSGTQRADVGGGGGSGVVVVLYSSLVVS